MTSNEIHHPDDVAKLEAAAARTRAGLHEEIIDLADIAHAIRHSRRETAISLVSQHSYRLAKLEETLNTALIEFRA